MHVLPADIYKWCPQDFTYEILEGATEDEDINDVKVLRQALALFRSVTCVEWVSESERNFDPPPCARASLRGGNNIEVLVELAGPTRLCIRQNDSQPVPMKVAYDSSGKLVLYLEPPGELLATTYYIGLRKTAQSKKK